MGKRGERREVRNADQWIGAHFAQQHPGSVGDSVLDGNEVLKIHDGGGDPETAQVIAKKRQRRAVAVMRRHDVVAGIHLAHQRDRDGGHA